MTEIPPTTVLVWYAPLWHGFARTVIHRDEYVGTYEEFIRRTTIKRGWKWRGRKAPYHEWVLTMEFDA